MNIISIDYSKKSTGIYGKISADDYSLAIIQKKSATPGEVLEVIYYSISKILQNNKYNFGIIEGYAVNFNHGFGMIPQIEIGGVIRLLFQQQRIPLIEIPVQTWKRITGIKDLKKATKAQKAIYLQTVNLKYGKLFDTTDEADAYLMYRALKAISGKTRMLMPVETKIKSRLMEIIGEKTRV